MSCSGEIISSIACGHLRSASLSFRLIFAIDKLDKQAFRELTDIIQNQPDDATQYMLMYRVSRELERVGDLLGNIAEDIIYLVTGDIVRHDHLKDKKR